MKSWNIEVASERKQRELMKTGLEELSIEAETVPLPENGKLVVDTWGSKELSLSMLPLTTLNGHIII